MKNASPQKHSILTRSLHAALATAVITQLVSSQFMEPPAPDNIGNWIFSVHQYSGLVAAALAFGFWLTVFRRRGGTQLAFLFPWFSSKDRYRLRLDLLRHWRALRRFTIPKVRDNSALPPAIHGLGLLLMTAMAVSGTLYYFLNAGDPDARGVIGVIMFVHTNLANLVWAYLIGHAGIAMFHHYTAQQSLSYMWSFRDSTTSEGQNHEPQR